MTAPRTRGAAFLLAIACFLATLLTGLLSSASRG